MRRRLSVAAVPGLRRAAGLEALPGGEILPARPRGRIVPEGPLAARRSPRPGGSGFTLLEMVITISVLTSVALATTLVVVPVARQSRISREVAAASTEAKRILEEIHATPFRDVVTRFPDGSISTVPGLPSGQITVQYADPAADPLLIQVRLTWTSPDLGAMVRVFDTVKTE